MRACLKRCPKTSPAFRTWVQRFEILGSRGSAARAELPVEGVGFGEVFGFRFGV